MVKILEFREFKNLLIKEAEETPDAADAPAPAPAPEPVPAPAPEPALAPEAELPPAPGEQPPVAAAPGEIQFVFMDDASKKPWRGNHDENGGVKRFTQYAIPPDELAKWIDVHEFEEDNELILAALAGKRDMPKSVYKKFKSEVMDGTLGTDKGTIDITFDSEKKFDNPSTTNLEVVFLKSHDAD
jgi:hypothetical protein